MTVEALLRFWNETAALEAQRRRRGDLRRRELIEQVLDWYGWPWSLRYSRLIDRSVIAEEAAA